MNSYLIDKCKKIICIGIGGLVGLGKIVIIEVIIFILIKWGIKFLIIINDIVIIEDVK